MNANWNSACVVSLSCAPEFLLYFALLRIVLLASTEINVMLSLVVVLILVPTSYGTYGGSNQNTVNKELK